MASRVRVPLPSSLDSRMLPVLFCQPRPSNSMPWPSSAPSIDHVVSRVISWSAIGWFQLVMSRTREQLASPVSTEIETRSSNSGSESMMMSTSPPALTTVAFEMVAMTSPSRICWTSTVRALGELPLVNGGSKTTK